MKKFIIVSVFIIFSISLNAGFSYAQPMNPRLERCQPTYGKYCCDSKWGWYGARRIVKTPVDTRDILVRFFALYNYIKVGIIKERGSFFEAEVTDEKGDVVDYVIIDKRTGRSRSVY